jgi:hypothetical protein
MSIFYVLEICSYVFLYFEDCLSSPQICFSIALQAFRLVQEFGSLIRLEGIEFIHLQRVNYYIKN